MMVDIQVVQTETAPAAIGPYSQALIAGGLVFCSGQIALDAETGEIAGGNAAEQTGKVMQNLKAVLAAAGCELTDVVKTTIYIRDLNDFAEVNEAYALALGDHRPARATVEVSRLPKDVLVEVDCIAAIS